MKVYKKIYFKTKKGNEKVIYLGEPIQEGEMEEMFKLRYEVYVEHNYISKKLFPDRQEKDSYDLEKKCIYFIAVIDDEVIGSIRVIRDDALPTEKECFKFRAPKEIKEILRDRRAELSRLIAKKHRTGGNFLPRHLVLLGLLSVALEFALKNNIEGGYAFIKNSLYKKLKKIRIPFHTIKSYQQIYDQAVLRKYFHQEKNPVRPIYFLRSEIEQYLNWLFNNKLFFEKLSETEYRLKRINRPLFFIFLLRFNKV